MYLFAYLSVYLFILILACNNAAWCIFLKVVCGLQTSPHLSFIVDFADVIFSLQGTQGEVINDLKQPLTKLILCYVDQEAQDL